jgi:hypothetical protein
MRTDIDITVDFRRAKQHMLDDPRHRQGRADAKPSVVVAARVSRQWWRMLRSAYRRSRSGFMGAPGPDD